MEPGTSTSSTPSVPLSNIKTEPGLPLTTQRLTSYRLPRDLTLGGNVKIEKPKKMYTPNLNVQRNKKKDEAIPVKVEPTTLRNNDRGRGRGRGDRGRGRGSKTNIIQSTSVWSEGIYAEPTVSRKSDGSRASSSTNARKYMEKPKLNLNMVVDEAEEERKLRNLLNDDFIDDGTDTNEKMPPLLLPRVEKHIDSNAEIKKSITSGKVMNIKKETPCEEDEKTSNISQLVKNKTNSYILIQFPDRLPGLESKEESGPKQPNESNSESNNKAKTEYCTLNNLKSGFLGKLQILKSGKARLRVGETSFFVDTCAQQNFQQDLLAAKVDTVSLKGSLINLGPVNNKLICSPNIESMLKNS